MKRLLALLFLMLTVSACAGVGAPGENVAGDWGQSVKYLHDDVHDVSCWFIVGTNGGGSLSCMPDSQVTLP